MRDNKYREEDDRILVEERQVLDSKGNTAASWHYSIIQGGWLVVDHTQNCEGRYVGMASSEYMAMRYAKAIAVGRR